MSSSLKLLQEVGRLVTLPPRNGSQCRKNEGRSCWRISKPSRDPHPPPSKLECRAGGWRKQEGAVWLGLKHHYSAPLSWTGSLAHVTLPTGPASSHFWPWFPTWLDEPLYFPGDTLVETGTITYFPSSRQGKDQLWSLNGVAALHSLWAHF